MFDSPFHKLSKNTERKLVRTLLIVLAILFLVMRYFDAPLKNDVSPYGIVSFELAKELQQSERILNSWDVFAKTSAGMSLGLDFLFLIIYSVFIALLIHRLNERLWKHSKIYAIGITMIWCVFVAAFFDFIENIAIIQLLLGDLQQKWSSIAYYCASLKFSLLTLAVLFIVLNLMFSIFRKQ